MMHATQRHQPHHRCIRSRRTMKSQVTVAAPRARQAEGTARPHAAPQAARVHANCRMLHLMQLRALPARCHRYGAGGAGAPGARTRALPVVAEHAAHPGLGKRPACGGAVQHHETLRRGKRPAGARGPGRRQARRRTGHRRGRPFPAALAHHAQLPASLVHIGEQEPGGPPRPAARRAPWPARPPGPGATPARPGTATHRPGQATPAAAVPGGPACRRPAPGPGPGARAALATWAAAPARAGAPAPDYQPGHRPAPDTQTVPGLRPPAGSPTQPPRPARHDLAVSPPRQRLPVDPVEDIGRHHVTKAHAPLFQEPCQAHDVERVGPHRRRGVPASLQVRQERIRLPGASPRTIKPVRTSAALHSHRHGQPPQAAPRFRMNPDPSRPGDLRPLRRVGPPMAG